MGNSFWKTVMWPIPVGEKKKTANILVPPSPDPSPEPMELPEMEEAKKKARRRAKKKGRASTILAGRMMSGRNDDSILKTKLG